MRRYSMFVVASLVLAGAVVAIGSSAPAPARADSEGSYRQINLVSDLPGQAKFQDPDLVNPWGLSRNPTGPWWVSDNGTGKSTLYNGDGTKRSLVVTIPAADGTSGGTPTGTVFNTVNATKPTDFLISANGKAGPSLFMFATEDGTISGWNPNVDSTHAVVAVNRSTVGAGAVYKGLAIARRGTKSYIYATDFRAGTVDMFDARFRLVRTFTDPKLAYDCPLPNQCYAPFGIQEIGGRLYVTFALQDPDKKDDVNGPGNGFVDIFDVRGRLLRRFVAQGALNSPWGLALAPEYFGRFSRALLVGNFGDGRINAYDPDSGEFLGQLSGKDGKPITIDGLWGIAFGNGGSAGAVNELFFASGLNDEANGLFGKIQVEAGD